jgi:ribosomal protein S6--L-glutamate ligase
MSHPKIGVVGIPGKWSTELLADELAAITGYRLVIDLAAIRADLVDGSLWFNDINLCQLDGLVIKKVNETYSPDMLDRLALLGMAEKQGVRVFSPTAGILALVNRLSCTMAMQAESIPMPPTAIATGVEQAFQSVVAFNKAILKPHYSSKARGMTVVDMADGEDSVRANLAAFHQHNPTMYIQQMLELPGQDLGLVFLGGQYLGTYARVNQGDAWNTTIHSGGKYAAYTPTDDIVAIAQKAQSIFGLDFTTVDVAETANGPVVFEVSAFGGFRGAKEGIGINAAAEYARYVVNQIS